MLDPVSFSGDGQYNVNNFKEITVTDSFMGLDKKTRNCQKFETYNECVTNHYINKVLNQCGCSPSLLSLTKKVKKIMLEEIDNV